MKAVIGMSMIIIAFVAFIFWKMLESYGLEPAIWTAAILATLIFGVWLWLTGDWEW